MVEMLTTNCGNLVRLMIKLFRSFFTIFLLVNCNQFVSTTSDNHDLAIDSKGDLISHCIPGDYLDVNKIINVHDVDGESSVYLKSSGSEKQLTQCVTVVRSSPGFGLIVHPVSLQLTTDHLVITVYQLHLASKTSQQLFKWFGSDASFDSNDQHQVDSVVCDLRPKDNLTTILITFEPASDNVTWKSIDFKLLITSFLPIKDPLGSCPDSFYFDCGSGQCIRQSLHCDGFANCQNGIDEHGCSLSTHEIFFIVIAIIIMLSIVIGLIWYARRQEANEDQPSQSKSNKIITSTVTAL